MCVGDVVRQDNRGAREGEQRGQQRGSEHGAQAIQASKHEIAPFMRAVAIDPAGVRLNRTLPMLDLRHAEVKYFCTARAGCWVCGGD